MRTLRARLIISHLLPVLLILPLVGVALVYLLETQLLLSNLSSELTSQGQQLAEMSFRQPEVWTHTARASDFVEGYSPLLQGKVMLLTPDGRLLASSDPGDAAQIGQPVKIYQLQVVQQGETSFHTSYSIEATDEVAEAYIPVMDAQRQLTGIVRMSRQVSSVYDRFVQLRRMVIAILFAAGLASAALGWWLALSLQRPINQVSTAVWQLSRGERLEPLPEKGPLELQQLSHSVNTLVERLHSMELSRKQLLANLVHEIGRPLGALRSAIQALLSGADQEAALRQELLQGLDEQTGRLKRLLDELAHLHEQVLGTLELDRRPTELTEWLTRLLSPWREAAQARRLKWETGIPDDLPSVNVDPDRLAQAVENLVNNAIKYTPPGGKVSISAGVEGQETWIQVADTGPGILPEDQEHLFKPFFRGKQSGRFPQGMGLGLSIAQNLVTAHQGRITVNSDPGQGSTFTIYLPLE